MFEHSVFKLQLRESNCYGKDRHISYDMEQVDAGLELFRNGCCGSECHIGGTRKVRRNEDTRIRGHENSGMWAWRKIRCLLGKNKHGAINYRTVGVDAEKE